jgi:hypothetical protein
VGYRAIASRDPSRDATRTGKPHHVNFSQERLAKNHYIYSITILAPFIESKGTVFTIIKYWKQRSRKDALLKNFSNIVYFPVESLDLPIQVRVAIDIKHELDGTLHIKLN